MNDLEFRRRVMASWGISGDKWEGFDFGIVFPLQTASGPALRAKIALTPLIPVVAGHSVEWKDNLLIDKGQSYLQHAFVLVWYNADKQINGFNARIINPRTVTIAGDVSYVAFNVDMDRLSGAYLKDVTTGEYLWRGSDYGE